MEIQLLEFLNNAPIEKWNDLIRYFEEKYPNHDTIAKDLKLLIEELKDSNLIRLSNNDHFTLLGKIIGETGIGRITFDKFKEQKLVIEAKITLAGRNYLLNIERLEKQDKINTQQKTINLFIVIFTGALTIIAIGTFIKDIYKPLQEDKKPLQELQKTLQLQNNSMQLYIYHDSVFWKFVKDSIEP